jgi:oxygen-dependent protoporphyrinogen oxidase
MIGIVGGGVSGLFLLHFLRKTGADAVLFESSAEPGGVMKSRVVEGPNGPVAVDVGPQRTRLTPALAEVLSDVGLTSEIVRAPERLPFTILHEGRVHPAPMGVRGALASRLISPGGKVRALADLVTSAPRPDESVEKALTRKLGTQIYRRLAGPLFGGLYGSDPSRMACRHSLLPALRRAGGRRSLLRALVRASRFETIPIVSFREGLGALPRALAAHHGTHVRLGDPVQEVVQRRGGFEIASSRARLQVDQVVLTLPAHAAAKVVAGVAPAVSEALARLRYNPLAVVPLVVPSAHRAPVVGSGYKLTLDQKADTRGATSHDALFARTGLFTAFLGGMGYEGVVERTDAEIMDTARSDFFAAMAVEGIPLLVHRTAMPAWDVSWSALDGISLPGGLHLCAAFAERPGIAGRLEDARRLAARLGVPSGVSR